MHHLLWIKPMLICGIVSKYPFDDCIFRFSGLNITLCTNVTILPYRSVLKINGCVCVCVCGARARVCVCVCVCVFTSIHREGFISASFANSEIDFTINLNQFFHSSSTFLLKLWYTIKQVWSILLQCCQTKDIAWHVSIAAKFYFWTLIGSWVLWAQIKLYILHEKHNFWSISLTHKTSNTWTT